MKLCTQRAIITVPPLMPLSKENSNTLPATSGSNLAQNHTVWPDKLQNSRIPNSFFLVFALDPCELCGVRFIDTFWHGLKIYNQPDLMADVISGVLLLLFLYTSLNKLADYTTFEYVLTRSPLLKPIAGFVAWILPVAESGIAILLFIPSSRLKGLYASFILISLFTLYLIYMIAFTPDLPCQCGGVLKLLTWPQHVFFNLFFVLLSLTGIVLYKRNKMRRSESPP
jgi:hypothetical protein